MNKLLPRFIAAVSYKNMLRESKLHKSLFVIS